MHVERSLLEGYRACGPRAHANALQRLPRNMRLMYVHAYQVRRQTLSHALPPPLLLVDVFISTSLCMEFSCGLYFCLLLIVSADTSTSLYTSAET